MWGVQRRGEDADRAHSHAHHTSSNFVAGLGVGVVNDFDGPDFILVIHRMEQDPL